MSIGSLLRHLPKLHRPHPVSTGWAIKDDDERIVSVGAGPHIGIGKVTLRLAPTFGNGAKYELHGSAAEVGIGVGPKDGLLKGYAKEFVEGLEKTAHYSISTGMPGGTIGPLYYRSGRPHVSMPAAFYGSTWFYVGLDLTALIESGGGGLICLIDPVGVESPPLPPGKEFLVDMSGISGRLYRRTIAWGLLTGLSAQPGLDASISGRGINILSVEKLEGEV